MTRPLEKLYVCSRLVSILLFSLTGCIKDHAVFVTSTNFGLDVSQQADQPPKMLIGYKRQEGVFLPAEHENTKEGEDTYSVLGYFCVMANPSLWDAIKALAPFSDDVPDALQITSVFATGLTAQQLGQDPSMRDFFQNRFLNRSSRARINGAINQTRS